MERFEELARKTFVPRKPPEPEEDAEEIMEGGIPPNQGGESAEVWEPEEHRKRDE